MNIFNIDDEMPFLHLNALVKTLHNFENPVTSAGFQMDR